MTITEQIRNLNQIRTTLKKELNRADIGLVVEIQQEITGLEETVKTLQDVRTMTGILTTLQSLVE